MQTKTKWAIGTAAVVILVILAFGQTTLFKGSLTDDFFDQDSTLPEEALTDEEREEIKEAQAKAACARKGRIWNYTNRKCQLLQQSTQPGTTATQPSTTTTQPGTTDLPNATATLQPIDIAPRLEIDVYEIQAPTVIRQSWPTISFTHDFPFGTDIYVGYNFITNNRRIQASTAGTTDNPEIRITWLDPINDRILGVPPVFTPLLGQRYTLKFKNLGRITSTQTENSVLNLMAKNVLENKYIEGPGFTITELPVQPQTRYGFVRINNQTRAVEYAGYIKVLNTN